ncbi:MAG TPA: ECF-type sigma factor [Bryobacteraceae bacterium]|nr:ECF-type sigma factor [Bryobacteraceae bacterium]
MGPSVPEKDPAKARVTELLKLWGQGDRDAFDRLVDIVHEELRQLARRRMRLLPEDSSLQPTAMVNEVYLRLVDAGQVEWQDRTHFFAIAARLMRQVATDSARHHGRAKRGAGWQRIALEDCDIPSAQREEDILAVDEALTRLAALDERRAQVVELRFFGGLSHTEIAAALDVSVKTVKREWSFAKLWLAREMKR